MFETIHQNVDRFFVVKEAEITHLSKQDFGKQKKTHYITTLFH